MEVRKQIIKQFHLPIFHSPLLWSKVPTFVSAPLPHVGESPFFEGCVALVIFSAPSFTFQTVAVPEDASQVAAHHLDV